VPSPLIDWIVADWIAGRVAGHGHAPPPQIDLVPITDDARDRVVAYTGLTPTTPLPPPEGIDRREWIATNIASTQALLDPMLERMTEKLGPVKGAAQLWLGVASSAEIGVLIGYLAKRVLGQYEFVLLRENADGRAPRLLFVLPNLGDAVGRFEADETEFVTWVALHEVTHAVQFSGAPWLQDHLASLVRGLLDSAEERMAAPRRLRFPSRQAVERVGRAALRADVIGMFASGSERETIDRAQAVMAVIEGHAEHVMDAVAPDLLPSLPDLRKALNERRKVQSPLGRLVSRALGMEMKMKQYERGKVFCDEIARVGGQNALKHLFSGPDALPTPSEIEDPAAWLRRAEPHL
jgi:coenzyme F420 biosynthesis associated uncharacterized protein